MNMSFPTMSSPGGNTCNPRRPPESLPCTSSEYYFEHSAEIELHWQGISLPKKILKRIPGSKHQNRYPDPILPKHCIMSYWRHEIYSPYWHSTDANMAVRDKVHTIQDYRETKFPEQWSTVGYATLTLAPTEYSGLASIYRRPLLRVLNEFAIPTCDDILNYLQTYFDSQDQSVVMFVFNIHSPHNASISITPAPQIYFPLIKNSCRELFFNTCFRYMLHITPMGIHVISKSEEDPSNIFYKYQRDLKMDWNQLCKKQYKVVLSDLVDEEWMAQYKYWIETERNYKGAFLSGQEVLGFVRVSCDEKGVDGEQVLSDNDGKVLSDNDEKVLGDNDGKVSGDNDEKVLGDNDGKVSGDNDETVLSDNDEKVLGDDDGKVLTDEQVLGEERQLITKNKYYHNCNNILDEQWVQEEKWSMLPELVKGIDENLNGKWCWPIHYIPERDTKKIWVHQKHSFFYVVIEKIDHECISFGRHIHGFLLQPTEYVQWLEEDDVVITNERTIRSDLFWPHEKDGTPVVHRHISQSQTCAIQRYYTD